MIVDSLNNCALYENVHKDFAKVFDVLKKISTGKITGKIVLEDGKVWVSSPSEVNVINKPKMFEAHRNFIDIHYIVSGAENFGYSNIDRLETTKEYDENKDYELLNGNQEFITLKAGDFCIVFPQDAHIPAYQKIGNDILIRVVAKIRY